MSRFFLLMVWLFIATFPLISQNPKRVLFLGNSYTQVNNLPQILTDVAASVGDSVVTDRSTPGGYTLQLHSTNSNSLDKLMQGGWDFVVLQEQSQRPSFPINQVITDVFPYARFLDSVANAYNSCAETVFYCTWGRKNGDASNCSWWPPVCTYEGMDSLLQLRYMMMADSNQTIVSPVGAVWKYIRQYYPAIELYQADESHPSAAGSYAAACCFYTTLFRKNPLLINYDYSLTETDANSIRNAVKKVVYDHLTYWHIGEYDPISGFSYEVNDDLLVTFNNLSSQAQCFLWDFGDGQQSVELNPMHVYASSGTYNVRLMAMGSGYADTIVLPVTVVWTNISQCINSRNEFAFPNPVEDRLVIELPKGDIQRVTLVNELGVSINMPFLLENNHIRLNLAQVSSGFYVVKIETDQESSLYKIIKK